MPVSQQVYPFSPEKKEHGWKTKGGAWRAPGDSRHEGATPSDILMSEHIKPHKKKKKRENAGSSEIIFLSKYSLFLFMKGKNKPHRNNVV